MKPEIKTIAEWLSKQAESVPFGEVSVKIILHAGAISRTEKTVTEKTIQGPAHGN